MPFQRSTAVLYWNKEAFAEAGLDPEKYPKTWNEMVAYGKAVTKKDAPRPGRALGCRHSGQRRLGTMALRGAVAQNGVRLMNDAGNKSDLTDPKVVEALKFWVDLNRGSRRPPARDPGDGERRPSDFLEERIVMIWTTTGNLTNLRANAKFDFGLAPYPGNPAPASVLGGGNLYIFKKSAGRQKEAALKFIKFLTSDEILADWGINTGYVPPRDGAWNTAALKAYAAKVPDVLVARDQIPVSVPEWSTHENARTGKVLNRCARRRLDRNEDAGKGARRRPGRNRTHLRPYR